MSKLLFCLILASLLSTVVRADNQLEDEISGFTTDNTITRVGHDFVRFLGDYRNTTFPKSKYNLSVYERPSARWGNLIWVEHNHRTVYRTFLSPSTSQINKVAEQAATEIHKTINQQKLKNLFLDTFDIERDEI